MFLQTISKIKTGGGNNFYSRKTFRTEPQRFLLEPNFKQGWSKTGLVIIKDKIKLLRAV